MGLEFCQIETDACRHNKFHAAAPGYRNCGVKMLLFCFQIFPAVAEQQADAPDARQRNQCVDNPADNSGLPTKEPSYQVKAENAHQAPVEAANDGKYQSNRIHLCRFLSFKSRS